MSEEREIRKRETFWVRNWCTFCNFGSCLDELICHLVMISCGRSSPLIGPVMAWMPTGARFGIAGLLSENSVCTNTYIQGFFFFFFLSVWKLELFVGAEKKGLACGDRLEAWQSYGIGVWKIFPWLGVCGKDDIYMVRRGRIWRIANLFKSEWLVWVPNLHDQSVGRKDSNNVKFGWVLIRVGVVLLGYIGSECEGLEFLIDHRVGSADLALPKNFLLCLKVTTTWEFQPSKMSFEFFITPWPKSCLWYLVAELWFILLFKPCDLS